MPSAGKWRAVDHVEKPNPLLNLGSSLSTGVVVIVFIIIIIGSP
jgi:hypothetical protein